MNFAVILAVWCVTGTGLTAIGKICFREASYSMACVLGFCIILLPLTALHLLVPLNQVLFLILATIGVFWLFANHRISFNKTNAVFLIIAVVLALLASRNALDYDDGLYHIQIIKWYSTYAVVPGLANLHSRFGFNSAYYLFASIFDGLPGGAAHYAAGVLWLATLGICLKTRFGRILVLPLGLWASYVSTLNNDLPIVLLTLIIGTMLFETIRTRHVDLRILILLAVAGSTIKLSFVCFAASGTVLAFFLVRPALRQLLATGLAAASLFCLWMIHGLCLSGYPLYPLTLTAFSIDWRLPVQVAVSEREWVTAWAKAPGTATVDISGNWIPKWWQYSAFNLNASIPLLLGLFSTPLSLFKHPRWLFFLPLLVGTVYWFFVAPDVRFAAGIFWLAAAALFYEVFPVRLDQLIFKLIVICAALLCLVGLVPTTSPNDEFQVYKVEGQSVYAPLNDDRCYDHLLPCAAYSASIQKLQLREPGNLTDGFSSHP